MQLKLWCSAGILLVAGQVWAFNQSDMKSVSTLERMTQRELAHEATSACREMTIANKFRPEYPADVMARTDRERGWVPPYLETIGLVARKSNGREMPAWVGDMKRASMGDNPGACVDVQDQVRQ